MSVLQSIINDMKIILNDIDKDMSDADSCLYCDHDINDAECTCNGTSKFKTLQQKYNYYTDELEYLLYLQTVKNSFPENYFIPNVLVNLITEYL